jgi:hypothetical protein
MRAAPLAFLSIGALVAGCFTAQAAPSEGDADVDAAEANLDVVGDWHACGLDLHLGSDGTALVTSLFRACTSTGSYHVSGRVLSATWDAPACTQDASWQMEFVPVDDGMVLVNLATGRSRRYASDTAPRSLWRLDATDGSGASTTMRILGGSGTEFVEGCYWSTDLGCGGLISCGGTVTGWTTDGATFGATAACTGECPCSAELSGNAASVGGYEGTFSGTNCMRMFAGEFTATALEMR